MKVIYDYEKVDPKYGRGIALGNFDGIHIGHQKLVKLLLDKSKSKKLHSCVYTFINHTVPIISNSNQLQYITNLDAKISIFRSLGIDMLFLDKFNQNLMSLSPKEFVEDILVRKLNCKEAIVGFDYHFGHKAEGDVSLLKELGKFYGFEVTVIDAVQIDNEKVSSSNIRKYILNGEIEKANQFLGRYFSLYNKVVHGDARGRKLGYPTANMLIDPLQLIPMSGVYGTLVKVGAKYYKGATFIGTKTTFDSYVPSIETFIIDYDGDLYDQFIDIYFIHRIRNQIKFKTADELVLQMRKDIQEVKKHLQPNINMLK